MKPCALCTGNVEDNESEYCEFCQLLRRGELGQHSIREFIGEQAFADLQVWIAENEKPKAGASDE